MMKQVKKVWKRVWALFCVLLTLPGVASASTIAATAPPLGTIRDTGSAIAAVQTQAAVMTASGALRTPVGARDCTIYSEYALANSAAVSIEGLELTLNAATVNAVGERLDVDKIKRELDAAMEQNDAELVWSESMSVMAEFQMSDTDIDLKIQPDILTVTSVDAILIRTPFYNLIFRLADLADDLTRDLNIQLRDISDTIEPVIEVTMSNADLAGNFTLSFTNSDDEDKVVVLDESSVTEDQDLAVASVYNEMTGTTSGKIRRPGVYKTTGNKKRFNDLEGQSSQRKKAIQQLADSGIVHGYSDGGFHPNETVNRGQFVKMIMNTVGKINNSLKPKCSDVKISSYYYHHAATAEQKGYMEGYKDGKFHGEYTLNKAQICKVIGRILKEKNYSVKSLSQQLDKYSDKDAIPEYAREGVAVMTSLGIVSEPDGRFNAGHLVSRGEVAEMVYRMLKYI